MNINKNQSTIIPDQKGGVWIVNREGDLYFGKEGIVKQVSASRVENRYHRFNLDYMKGRNEDPTNSENLITGDVFWEEE